MKKYLYALILIFVASNLGATTQVKDVIVIDGVSHRLITNPLNTLYNEITISEKLKLNTGCSANWRGYVSTWGVNKSMLILLKIERNICLKAEIVGPAPLFKNRQYPIKALWYTGPLEVLVMQKDRQADVHNYDVRNGRIISRKPIKPTQNPSLRI